MKHLEKEIFDIQSEKQFEEIALQIFRFQAENNPVYKAYLEYLGTKHDMVSTLQEIPFFPIEFFKSHNVCTGDFVAEEIFTSSGTTGMQTSQHFVKDVSLYEQSFLKAFELFYGNPSQFTILALLPGYLERKGSSLIYMVKKLIDVSEDNDSGFFLRNHEDLVQILKKKEAERKPTLLIGVSFALLDLIEKYQLKLQHTTVMETGGMKGRRKEMTREELHETLCNGLGVLAVHSEYGMTELLSQAYSTGDSRFTVPPWMRIQIRDPYDPFTPLPEGKTGGINVIDLANLHSCSFIETKDLGKIHPGGKFEVLGRFDNSDIRGCNLMVL